MDQLVQPALDTWAIGLIIIVMVWSLAWKGFALWKAARLSNRNWFIALLVFNTIGILDIIYLYFFAMKYKVETIDVDETSTEPTSSDEVGSETETKE